MLPTTPAHCNTQVQLTLICSKLYYSLSPLGFRNSPQHVRCKKVLARLHVHNQKLVNDFSRYQP